MLVLLNDGASASTTLKYLNCIMIKDLVIL